MLLYHTFKIIMLQVTSDYLICVVYYGNYILWSTSISKADDFFAQILVIYPILIPSILVWMLIMH